MNQWFLCSAPTIVACARSTTSRIYFSISANFKEKYDICVDFGTEIL